MADNKRKILVVGGGISGMTTALEAAETGYDVVLIEKEPSLGGRVARFHQYFPKQCPPLCGLEINYRRLRPNPNIQTLVNSEVASVSGSEGNYQVKVKRKASYVNEKCTACGDCTHVCPSERDSQFDYGMQKTKAVYIPHNMAHPARYVIDKDVCQAGCDKCVAACKYDAIDLNMEETTYDLEVASIVYATGWKPYDASKIKNFGFGQVPNVINNVMMERLASVSGPTAGKIQRPSDNKEVSSIAFIQCAGSRDENHLPYCSSVCCLASFKQADYVAQANPDAKVYIFYIDIRTPGKYEDFATKIMENPNLTLIKGKVAKVTAAQDSQVSILAEDIIEQKMVNLDVDMVVLATGMEATLKSEQPQAPLKVTDQGFVEASDGIFSAGVASEPGDVNTSIQDATGAAIKAIQTVVGN